MRKNIFLIFIIFSSLLFNVGCASVGKFWKGLISDDAAETKAQERKRMTTFSNQPSLPPSTYRKYKRTKRADLENEAHLDSRSGSLWVMEGQGAYLFSQNVVRMIGDPLSIRIEGDPADQLTSKANVISKLLAQIEERRRRAAGRGPATTDEKGKKTDGAAPVAQNLSPNAQVPAAPQPIVPQQAQSDEKSEFNVKNVPTRVVERLVDGNYRVRGTQPFMIGSREYKVIVSGIVRAEDFNEEGISAAQLLDSNFDIVSSKSTEMR